MANIEVKEIDEQSWEKFIASHSEANFLHSWRWGIFHERMNHKVVRRGFYVDSRLLGVVQCVVVHARRGRHIVVAGGPIMDWSNKKLIQTCLEELKSIAKANKCIFIRIRPQLIDNDENRAVFKNLGFKLAPMHVTADLTSQLDLSKSDEELKKTMRKGTRYELNRSEKLEIKIESASDDKFIKEFCRLQQDTAKRQRFVPFTNKFLTEQFNTFAESGNVLIYRSTFQGKLLAMAFIIFYGPEAAYHYGASTELARKYPGAYAIQKQAIDEARRRGCLRYNFWGVTHHGQTKHRFYGVSVFKRGFGGEDVAYLPARDLVVSPAYYVTYIFETARRKMRRL